MTTIAPLAPKLQTGQGALPNSPTQAADTPEDAQAALRERLIAMSDALRAKGSPKRTKKREATEDEKRELAERLAMYSSIASANRKDGFIQMPARVLHDPTISPAAKGVYQHLLSYFRHADDIYGWPSEETISHELGKGFSVRTVVRALAELEAHGYIEKWRRGQGNVNRYFLNPLDYAQSFGLEFEAAWDLMCKIGSSGNAKNAEPYVPKWQRMKNEDIENTSDIIHGFSRSGSAAGLGDGGVAGATIRNESRKPAGSESNEGATQTPTESKPKTPPRQETGRENAKGVEEDKNKRKRRKHAPGEVPPPLPVYIAGQLAPISAFYGDTSRKSSKTSVAWYFADVHARGMDEYDFVDFFTEAKDAVVAHGNSINKSVMGYFLSCLEGCVDRWCAAYDKALAKNQTAGESAPVAGEPEADQPPADLVVSAAAPAGADTQEEPVVESLAEEEQAEQVEAGQVEQVEATTSARVESQAIGTAGEIQAEEEERPASIEVEGSQAEQATGSVPAGAEENQVEQVEAGTALTEESQAEQITGATAGESQAEQAEEYPDLEIEVAPLPTDDPTHGGTERDAKYWGILLVKHFGAARYQSFVVPTRLKDRYGVVLVDKATRAEYPYRSYTEVGREIYPEKTKKRSWHH